MTREEVIANLNMISVAFVEPVTKEQRELIDETFDMAIKALQEPKADYKSFCEWIASEIFSEEWEFNKNSFEEIACRKLSKLGIVKADEGKWVMESEE